MSPRKRFFPAPIAAWRRCAARSRWRSSSRWAEAPCLCGRNSEKRRRHCRSAARINPRKSRNRPKRNPAADAAGNLHLRKSSLALRILESALLVLAALLLAALARLRVALLLLAALTRFRVLALLLLARLGRLLFVLTHCVSPEKFGGWTRDRSHLR